MCERLSVRLKRMEPRGELLLRLRGGAHGGARRLLTKVLWKGGGCVQAGAKQMDPIVRALRVSRPNHGPSQGAADPHRGVHAPPQATGPPPPSY